MTPTPASCARTSTCSRWGTSCCTRASSPGRPRKVTGELRFPWTEHPADLHMAEAVKALTTVLLVITYLLVATPVGLASRIVGDPLSRRRNRRATTYWVEPAGRRPMWRFDDRPRS